MQHSDKGVCVLTENEHAALAIYVEAGRLRVDNDPQLTRYMNRAGAMVPDPEGQWVHIKDFRAKGWKLDPRVKAS
jgi:flagellar hook protein FlgE